jgi:hypothetical protein
LRYEQAIADYELIYSDKDTNYGELKWVSLVTTILSPLKILI